MTSTAADSLRDLLTGDGNSRVCKDIPDSACRHQPVNFSIHIVSLAATKTGDGLADPKLVLAWLLGALGAPAAAIGLLVPVREALALLPQIFTAASIRSQPVRKVFWAAGSMVQGASVIAMAIAALYLDGAAAGWTIVGLLAIFAVARSVCSVSYKDVLGKTVSKQTRGTATGTASSVAAGLVLVFGILLSIGWIPITVTGISASLAAAGLLWIAAGLLFTRLEEHPGATEGGENAFDRTIRQFSLLREDGQLRLFIVVRGLLIATALAPPFVLALGGQAQARGLSTLGWFVIAASLASLTSAYVWGRLSDRSSRHVLIAAAALAAAVLLTVGGIGIAASGVAEDPVFLAAGLFVLVVAHQGVRLGRSTHLVDMSDEDRRASYTALSNTAIGILLAVGGLFGLAADWLGYDVVLLAMGTMCGLAAIVATRLEEVQR